MLFPAPNSRVFLTSNEDPWREDAEVPEVEDRRDFPGKGPRLLAEGVWGETLHAGGVHLPLEFGVLDLVALF